MQIKNKNNSTKAIQTMIQTNASSVNPLEVPFLWSSEAL